MDKEWEWAGFLGSVSLENLRTIWQGLQILPLCFLVGLTTLLSSPSLSFLASVKQNIVQSD